MSFNNPASIWWLVWADLHKCSNRWLSNGNLSSGKFIIPFITVNFRSPTIISNFGDFPNIQSQEWKPAIILSSPGKLSSVGSISIISAKLNSAAMDLSISSVRFSCWKLLARFSTGDLMLLVALVRMTSEWGLLRALLRLEVSTLTSRVQWW